MHHRVTKETVSGRVLEKPTKEGDSPVDESRFSLVSILSTTEHV